MVNPNYDAGVNAGALTTDVSEYYGLITKIARQIIEGARATDRLAVFNKTPIDNGTTIEEAVVEMASSTAYNPDGTNEFAPTDPSLKVKYYKKWTDKQFATTVRDNQIRKVLTAGGDVRKLSEPIVSSLTNGDEYEKYLAVKGLFEYGATEGVFVNLGSVSKTNYKDILTTIKNTVSGMKFPNSNFNTAGIVRETLPENIRIIMPYQIKNAIDVNELAGVFNLSLAEINERIIEVDSGDKIFIVDERAILVYTRLYQMSTLYNPKGLFMNYWLTTDRLYAVSGLFDGCYMTLTE